MVRIYRLPNNFADYLCSHIDNYHKISLYQNYGRTFEPNRCVRNLINMVANYGLYPDHITVPTIKLCFILFNVVHRLLLTPIAVT